MRNISTSFGNPVQTTDVRIIIDRRSSNFGTVSIPFTAETYRSRTKYGKYIGYLDNDNVLTIVDLTDGGYGQIDLDTLFTTSHFYVDIYNETMLKVYYFSGTQALNGVQYAFSIDKDNHTISLTQQHTFGFWSIPDLSSYYSNRARSWVAQGREAFIGTVFHIGNGVQLLSSYDEPSWERTINHLYALNPEEDVMPAAAFNDSEYRVWFYWTDQFTGSLKGATYSIYDRTPSNVIDVFKTSSPEFFKIIPCDAHYANGMYYLLAVVQTKDELGSLKQYLVLMKSYDGASYSLHPHATLCELPNDVENYGFSLTYYNNTFYIWSGSQYVALDTPTAYLYDSIVNGTTITADEIVSISWTHEKATVSLSGKHVNADYVGRYVGIDVSVNGSAWNQAFIGVVDSQSVSVRDGNYTVTLNIEHAGLWSLKNTYIPETVDLPERIHGALSKGSGKYLRQRGVLSFENAYIEMWNYEPFEDSSLGVVGAPQRKGAVDTITSNQKIGLVVKDVEKFPFERLTYGNEYSANNITGNLLAWSYNTDLGTTQVCKVYVVVWYEYNGQTGYVMSPAIDLPNLGSRTTNTSGTQVYPSFSFSDNPPWGARIKSVGLIVEPVNDATYNFYPVGVFFRTGIWSHVSDQYADPEIVDDPNVKGLVFVPSANMTLFQIPGVVGNGDFAVFAHYNQNIWTSDTNYMWCIPGYNFGVAYWRDKYNHVIMGTTLSPGPYVIYPTTNVNYNLVIGGRPMVSQSPYSATSNDYTQNFMVSLIRKGLHMQVAYYGGGQGPTQYAISQTYASFFKETPDNLFTIGFYQRFNGPYMVIGTRVMTEREESITEPQIYGFWTGANLDYSWLTYTNLGYARGWLNTNVGQKGIAIADWVFKTTASTAYIGMFSSNLSPAYNITRGPFQLRSYMDAGDSFIPGGFYGDSTPGIEYRDHWWGNSDMDAVIGTVEGIRSYYCTNVKWHRSTVNSGTQVWLPGRAKFTISNPSTTKGYGFSIANKVYVSNGITNLEIAKVGSAKVIPTGSLVYVRPLTSDKNIKIYTCHGSIGSRDLSFADAVSYICGVAGVKTSFYSSDTSKTYGGFVLRLKATIGETVNVTTNVYNRYYGANVSLRFSRGSESAYYYTDGVNGSNNYIVSRRYRENVIGNVSNGSPLQVTYYVYFGRNHITVYCDRGYITEFAFPDVDTTVTTYDGKAVTVAQDPLDYPETIEITTNASSPTILPLSFFPMITAIDPTAPVSSALSDLIDKLPIIISPKYDGSIEFCDTPRSNTYNLSSKPEDVSFERYATPEAGALSMIVGDRNEYVFSNELAQRTGLTYRNISVQAVVDNNAYLGRKLQKIAMERMERYRVTVPLDLRVEVGDTANIVYKPVGESQKTITIVVEGYTCKIDNNGSAVMTIEGRRYYGPY